MSPRRKNRNTDVELAVKMLTYPIAIAAGLLLLAGKKKRRRRRK